jgi:hypothetical protein
MTIVLLPLAKLVEDLDLYPRSQVSDNHVADLVAALEAGDILPPPVIDQKSKRIIDGFHRRRAAIKVFGSDALIEVDQRRFKTEADMFVAAVQLNIVHGLRLAKIEQRRVALRLSESGADDDLIGKVLHVPPDRVQRILVRVVTITEGGGTVRLEPLKRSVFHYSGKSMTEPQATAMRSAPGSPYTQLIRQLRQGIRYQLLNSDDANMLAELAALGGDIGAYLQQFGTAETA